jgi:predicted ATPase/DNA-binding SARP family transcriptional activator
MVDGVAREAELEAGERQSPRTRLATLRLPLEGGVVASDDGLEIRLLGPVEAVRAGRKLDIGGKRQRALLALLALEPGRSIPADRLIDDLWTGEPTEGAATTLKVYVSRLRGSLGEPASLRAIAGGYALGVAPDAIDVTRFEARVREAASEGRRSPRRSAAAARDALGLWRGRPFGELADNGALRAEAERLEELRLEAVELRIEADLGLGQSSELVPELEGLVSRNPHRERLWRQLMLALYRADRQADALAAYHRARAALDEQLGIEPGPELQGLEAAILRHEVPGATPSDSRANLPGPLTSFIGREIELAELARLLGEARLLTITGVGGVGKTRLALEAARRASDRFVDGIAYVDLAPLSDPSLVAGHIGTALGLREQPGVDPLAQLSGHLEGRSLLVLDNCEHLRDACAALAREVLRTSSDLRILATSREVLGVPGEVTYGAPPLSLAAAPDDGFGTGSRPERSDAVRLFLARAREARPDLADDDETITTISRICADLDGLPLGIELAAARARASSPADIAARLRDRFQFLVSWRRLAPARHRTLREALDWSYDLLDPDAQALLGGLSVFAGGCTLAAAAGVCLGGDESRAFDLLERLVDASLVAAEYRQDGTRYSFLETVRQYAAERLAGSASEPSIRRAHATWYQALAEEAAPNLGGADQVAWFSRLEAEHANLRATLAFLAESGDGDGQLRLSIALTRFWYVRGHLSEGRRALEQALVAGAESDPLLRRRALTAAASLALIQGDYAAATTAAEQSLEIARESGAPNLVANALSNLGAIVLAASDTDRAGLLLEEAVAVARTAGDERVKALAINNLGDLALTRGDYERARPLFEESLAILRQRSDTANVARALFNLGASTLMVGRLGDAEAQFHEGLRYAQEAGDQEDLAWLVEGFAALAASRGQADRAATLLGAADAFLTAMSADHKPFERRLRDETAGAIERLIGPSAAAELVARGRAMPPADVIELASRSTEAMQPD